jgi:SAM-dependent methyltransferase
MNHAQIIDRVQRYYTGRVLEHGPSARGVDWRSTESQVLRFAQLCRVFNGPGPFSVLDYGCGYGALYGYLDGLGLDVEFRGFDISDEMVRQARAQIGERPNTTLTSDEQALEPVDYVVSSGLFNVRQDVSRERWQQYVLDTIARFDSLSRRGFAFNVLTAYSDPERMRDDLYYAEPGLLFDVCKRNYSRHVALLHDYGLFEFTILVRKDVALPDTPPGNTPVPLAIQTGEDGA